MRYSQWWPRAAELWDKMEIKPNRLVEVEHVADYIINHEAAYKPIQDASPNGVPWPMIGIIHWREGNGNFATYLGNGQLLSHRTTIVPIGRGPFRTFFDGAVDALKVDQIWTVQDWRLEKILFYCETFNGFGYETWHDEVSPYVWGATNVQMIGKYVSDHNWQRVWDQQLGCAAMLEVVMHKTGLSYPRET